MRRFIYLISPPKIDSGFYQSLKEVLTSKKVKFFQLRVKNCSNSRLIEIAKRIKVITKKYKVKLIINDLPLVAKYSKADGCHLGQTDMSINHARKILKKNKIIGITCHGSKKLILQAIKENVNYIALGSFFKSQLKPLAKKAQKKLIIWCKKKTNVPIVAIGGINNKNYKNLIRCRVNYLAISSYIWNNPRMKPSAAIREFKLK